METKQKLIKDFKKGKITIDDLEKAGINWKPLYSAGVKCYNCGYSFYAKDGKKGKEVIRNKEKRNLLLCPKCGSDNLGESLFPKIIGHIVEGEKIYGK